MAPLAKRYYCDGYGYCYGTSPWASYGRWILLAAIIVGAFLIFLLFACVTSRRRRRRGMTPFKGTGWAAGGVPGQNPQYGASQPYYGDQPSAPPYSPNAAPNQGYYGQTQGQTQGYTPNQGYAPNQGYFGGQQGVELQQPDNAHVRAGENVYQPPQGPPPGK